MAEFHTVVRLLVGVSISRDLESSSSMPRMLNSDSTPGTKNISYLKAENMIVWTHLVEPWLQL